MCPDGSVVTRDSNNDCQFHPCPQCNDDVKLCPDGTTVTRDIHNDCIFIECPGCTDDVRYCSDGSIVTRDVNKDCSFPDCPDNSSEDACGADVRYCLDGSIVTRDINNNCDFPDCPTPAPSSTPSGSPTTVALSPVAPESGECPDDVRYCNDGTILNRDVDNDCNFPDCPTPAPTSTPSALPTSVAPSQVACTDDVRYCNDGAILNRDINNGCNFPECPTLVPTSTPSGSPTTPAPSPVASEGACTNDVSYCLDGTILTRDINNDCRFPDCPAPTTPRDPPLPPVPAPVTSEIAPVGATLAPRATPAPIDMGEYPTRPTFSGDNRFGSCLADPEGLFGWDNEQEKHVLKFKYELETYTSAEDLLIFTMQNRMMENTLPVLFPDQCVGEHGINRDRARRLRNLLVVGVSTYPVDIVTNRKFPACSRGLGLSFPLSHICFVFFLLHFYSSM